MSPDPWLERLDADALRRWTFRCLSGLAEHRAAIDALNVFPVPDGDTGTNMYRTLVAALGDIDVPEDGADPAERVEVLVRSALLAARGNSGVVLSQLIRGFVEVAAPLLVTDSDLDHDGGGLDAPSLAAAFVHADACAWAGVGEPVEGTILSVSRIAARDATAAAARGVSLGEVTGAALAGGQAALAATPAQLACLARAGVVDAGGAGLVVILASLHEVVTGDRVHLPIPSPPAAGSGEPSGSTSAPATTRAGGEGGTAASAASAAHQGAGRVSEAADPFYEVMYVLESPQADPARLREELLRLGDSVVVGGGPIRGGALHTVHVHTAEPGRAIDAGLRRGQAHDIRVVALASLAGRDEHHDAGADADPVPGPACPPEPSAAAEASETDQAAAGSAVAAERRPLGVVACASGPGMAQMFLETGAHVVEDRPGRRTSPHELLTAIAAAAAEHVVVLPNDRDARMAAEAAGRFARESGAHVDVIPTDTAVQAIAALAVCDAAADPEATIADMRAAVAGVRTGLVTAATRRAHTDVGWCEPGDTLGIVGEEVVAVGADPLEVAERVIERLCAGAGELLTVVSGEGAGELGRRVAAAAAGRHPDLEVCELHGGQPVYTLLVGVE